MVTEVSDVPKLSPHQEKVRGILHTDDAAGASSGGLVHARGLAAPLRTRQPRGVRGWPPGMEVGCAIGQVSLHPRDRRQFPPPPRPLRSPRGPQQGPANESSGAKTMEHRASLDSPLSPRGSQTFGPAHRTHPFRYRPGTLFRPAFAEPPRRK